MDVHYTYQEFDYGYEEELSKSFYQKCLVFNESLCDRLSDMFNRLRLKTNKL